MPSGIETEELPFSRIRRRKKANRGETFSARRDRSSNFSRLPFVEGNLLVMFCKSPMASRRQATLPSQSWCAPPLHQSHLNEGTIYRFWSRNGMRGDGKVRGPKGRRIGTRRSSG